MSTPTKKAAAKAAPAKKATAPAAPTPASDIDLPKLLGPTDPDPVVEPPVMGTVSTGPVFPDGHLLSTSQALRDAERNQGTKDERNHAARLARAEA